MKTINLKGKEYAPVSTRVEQLHKDHKECSINTETTFTDGVVITKATITFDGRSFTGHSYGKVGAEKAFEKLETVAVGRALAFAGYLSGGEIASYDEMEQFVDKNMTVEDACAKLNTATNLDELKSIFTSLGNLMSDVEVIAMKDELKNKLTV